MPGVLPEDAPDDFVLLFEIEPKDDARSHLRYLHIHCEAGKRFAPTNARPALGWPLRNTDLVVAVLRRGLVEMVKAARAMRRAPNTTSDTTVAPSLVAPESRGVPPRCKT